MGEILRHVGVVAPAQTEMLEGVTSEARAALNMTVLVLEIKDNRPKDSQVTKKTTPKEIRCSSGVVQPQPVQQEVSHS